MANKTLLESIGVIQVIGIDIVRLANVFISDHIFLLNLLPSVLTEYVKTHQNTVNI